MDGQGLLPYTTQKQEMEFLKPPEYHWRAPFFFRRTGDPDAPLAFNPSWDREPIRQATEQEIVFAASAGIDYWAFGHHGRHIAAGLDYVSTHPDHCGASSVIIYAWNEHSEGGFNNSGTGRRGCAIQIQYRAGDGEPEAFVFTIRPADAGSRLDLRRLEVAAQSVSKGSGADVSVSAGVTEVGTARIEGGDWARLAFALPPHLRAAADEVVVRLVVSGSGAGAVRLDDLRLRGHVWTRE